jgi:hypothetical protein
MKHYLSCLVFLSVFLLGPGCGGGDITQTGAEFMEEYSEVVCDRLDECGALDVTVSQCVNLVVGEICANVNCSETFTVPEDDWNACLSGEGNLDCASAEAGIGASACERIDLF